MFTRSVATDRSRAAVGRGVLIALAAVLLVAAGLLLLRSRTEDQPPADRFIVFYCPNCKHDFRVSERDFERLWDRREYRVLKAERKALFKCRKCGQMSAESRGPADLPPGTR